MQVHVCEDNDRSTSMSMSLRDMSGMTYRLRIPCKLIALANYEAEPSIYGLKNIGDVIRSMKVMNHNDVTPMLDREPSTKHEKRQVLLPAAEPSISQKQLPKPSANMKMAHRDALTPRLPALSKSSKYGRAVDISEEKQQCTTNRKKQKLKQSDPTFIKEKGENPFLISSKVTLFTAMLVYHTCWLILCFFLV